MKHIISEDGYWKKEIQLYERFRKDENPFAHYYPEKMASLLTLVNYFSKLVDFNQSHILEAGMGSGMGLILAAKRGARCTGVDISKEACRFATILKDDYLDGIQKDNFEIINEDILSYKPSAKFDLVLNIGSLEHLNTSEQLTFLTKMNDLSKKFVLIGVPDYTSPIFKSFMNYFSKQKRVYEEKHLSIDVEHLFNQSGITLLDKLGMGIGISGKHVNKNDSELVDFLRREFHIDDLSELEITAEKVNWLVDIEKSLNKKETDIYGFIDLFVGKITH